ncbi:Uncharacterised protein [Acinetobacter baumannii]|nr:Uncharacterised protein [Acinetobacter baumannii]
MQHLFELREFLIDHAFQTIVFKARQRLRQPAQQVGKDPLGVAHIRQNVLARHRFVDHRHQMVGDLCGGGQDRGYLSLTRVTLHDVGDAQKTFRIRYRGSAKFQHSHL